MKIYILHGKKGSPYDEKTTLLYKIATLKGFRATIIDDTDTNDPNKRAKRFLKKIELVKERFLIAGISMGGYVGANSSSYVDTFGLFLLSPAFYLDGYDRFSLPLKCNNITIIHGLHDKIVPIKNSICFAKKSNSNLHIVSDGHLLENSYIQIQIYFESFLNSIKSNP